jgi:ParB-like chromosome segregation protein Spo0J
MGEFVQDHPRLALRPIDEVVDVHELDRAGHLHDAAIGRQPFRRRMVGRARGDVAAQPDRDLAEPGQGAPGQDTADLAELRLQQSERLGAARMIGEGLLDAHGPALDDEALVIVRGQGENPTGDDKATTGECRPYEKGNTTSAGKEIGHRPIITIK